MHYWYDYDHIAIIMILIYSEIYAELALLQLFVKEEIELPQSRQGAEQEGENPICRTGGVFNLLIVVLCISNNLISLILLHSLQEYDILLWKLEKKKQKPETKSSPVDPFHVN